MHRGIEPGAGAPAAMLGPTGRAPMMPVGSSSRIAEPGTSAAPEHLLIGCWAMSNTAGSNGCGRG